MLTVKTSWFVTLVIIKSCSSIELNPPVGTVVAKFGEETFYVPTYIPESDRLSTPELIRVSGYESEEFDVTTEDGYILKLFHITGNSDSKDPPVIMIHGLMDSSDTFLMRRETSPAINLTGSGYDVWLANNRGNKYSRRHEFLDPDVDKVFWDFSFHENGYYDHTAFIDYVLKKTGKSQVIIVAHSQGVLNQMISGATRPEYNDKIKVFIALGPACFLRHLKGLDAAFPVVLPVLTQELTALGVVEFLNSNSTFVRFLQDLCTRDSKVGYTLCRTFFFNLFGPNPDQFEPEFLPVLMGQYFCGTSVKTQAHIGQVTNGHFGWYDHGAIGNLAKYRSIKAPLYNVTKFTSKIVLMVGKNDYSATVEDSRNLRDALTNVVYFEMPLETFAHLDFLHGNKMTKYFFPYLHEFLNKYK